MSGAVYSASAISDIDLIWDYTAETWGFDQANRYTLDIRAVCDDLASGRKMGRRVHEREGYLRYSIGGHVVFFKELGGGIVVMRVLHQRMDVARYLADDRA
ncbi:MAG: type II toxin-antitoxin system RelE/ParE family toxin [Paracoccaceae bacterium]|nr:type II toxin-antitoxin system RelE/ParE family toxin [Paracoccaceae bacterium]